MISIVTLCDVIELAKLLLMRRFGHAETLQRLQLVSSNREWSRLLMSQSHPWV